MSTEKNAHYRDEPLQWALRNLRVRDWDSSFVLGLCDFDIGDFGNFPVPEGVKEGLFSDTVRDNPKVLGTIFSSARHYPNDCFARTVESFPKAVGGITAVYKVAREIKIAAENQLAKEINKKDYDTFKRLVHYGFAVSYHTQRDYLIKERLIKQIAFTELAKRKEAIVELLKYQAVARSSQERSKMRLNHATDSKAEPLRIDNGKYFRGFDVYVFGGTVVLHNSIRNLCYVLLPKDIHRLEHFLCGMGSAKLYMSSYANVGEEKRKVFLRAHANYERAIMDAIAKIDHRSANLLCRAADVAYFRYMTENYVQDDPRAIKEQRDKWNENKLGDILDYEKISSSVSSLPMKESLEILLTYKCMPVPDYDYFAQANRQLTMYQENIQEAIENNAANTEEYKDILLYHKWMMLRCFFEKHGYCPGFVKEGTVEEKWVQYYPHVHPNDIGYTLMDNIDFDGAFIWTNRGTDILDLVKDKAICPKTINSIKTKNDMMKCSVNRKNYLMDVLMRNEPIDLQDVEDKREELLYDVKADDKPERKKENGRWFMEAHTEARLKQSEYEESVANYGSNMPGYFTGKKLGEKIKALGLITAPMSENLPVQQLYISFDIKKFSPYLPAKVHEDLDKQWAEAFGVPGLKHASKIFTEGNMHYIKGNIHHVFPKQGVDFEGFAGKKLTFYHCAVMGFTVRKLREAKLITQPGRFAALIDDGLLRLVLEKDGFDESKQQVLKVIEDIYNHACMRISWDKTFCSSFMATFLNEIRYLGRSITPGMRSVFRINNMSDNVVASLPDDLDYLASTVRGAIVAGASPVSCYIVYLWYAYDAFKRWKSRKGEFQDGIALLAFVPRALGGLGLYSLINLSGSVSTNNLLEGIGMLEILGHVFKELRPYISKHLNVKIAESSGIIGVGGSPNIQVEGTILRQDRINKLLDKQIVKVLAAPVMAALFPNSDVAADTFVELAKSFGARLPIHFQELVAPVDPIYHLRKISRKFLRASTALTLLSRRALTRVAYANKRDAQTLLNKYVR